MITVTNLSLGFSGANLFSHCNLTFTQGNCYGIIGANGAGKSTFLKLLSGELEPSTGDIVIKEKTRMSVLKQDHFAFDAYTVLDTIIMGNPRLYEVMTEKDRLYSKVDFTDADGLLAAELEAEFSELNGWDSETEASKLLKGLGIADDILTAQMDGLDGKRKVKVLLAQALFGSPDIILMDEPTNDLDIDSIEWLETFLLDFPGTVLVVSHDRYFLNTICTHIVDIDFSQVRIYVGNYDFWYESSQLIQKLKREQNKKNEERAKELQSFIERFSANKSKARQATSRKKLLEKLDLDDLPQSSRRYPFIGFKMDREPGKEILTVEKLSKAVNGEKVRIYIERCNAMSKLLNIVSSGFRQKVLESPTPTFVLYYSRWNPQSTALLPVFEGLANDLDGRCAVGAADGDREAEIDAWFRIINFPTAVLYAEGREAGRLCGVRSREQYLAFADEVLLGERPLRDNMSDTWVAVDHLGRALPTAGEAGLPKNDRTIAMFYFISFGENHPDPAKRQGPFDI
jgi:ABC-type multidrug transport system ATPase subunit